VDAVLEGTVSVPGDTLTSGSMLLTAAVIALRSTQLNLILDDAPRTEEPLIVLDRDTVEKIGRVGEILRSDAFERLLTMAVHHLQSNERDTARLLIGGIEREDIPASMPGLVDVLRKLQEVLLNEETRIGRKTDVLRLANTDPVKNIVAALAAFDDLYEKAVSSRNSRKDEP
jgi:hypothetical protein